LDPKDPLKSAREFVSRAYQLDGVTTLRHHGGEFLAYSPGGAYVPVSDEAIRAALYRFLDECRVAEVYNGERVYDRFKPTAPKVGNVLDALKAVCHASRQPPCWLDDEIREDPYDFLPCRNGVLHIPSRTPLPPTPKFFARHAVPFDWDEHAQSTRWLKFLSELRPNDAESRQALQEMFG
jgi:putative DNA primase/helicase